ncbi:uncharacterized protein BHQ10_000966 [Talaromyces amestolkiae]|uniref:N-acetyltransferase domain-containing protein n=1 Tax=Talaromyces amestolkiae TaxID=1196081 RepID=A0A364KN26_TALAM|nr:uncharacterized protein BHQ10_000966 [Talaromyces amestolkiae]RAO64954.1 hypothetical protein BHQ10_000966 [Talaromyces amestolkiae]
MAYQVFAKAQAQQRTAANTTSTTATSPPLSPPSLLAKQPPLHPAPLVLPQSASSSSSHRPPSIGDPNFTPTPFSEPLITYQTPHPHVTIDPVRTAHIPSLSRITGLLLPIRYPSSFYTACITDPVIASLSRVAVYHDHPVPSGPSTETTFGATRQSPTSTAGGGAGGLCGTDKVIGGIRCRLERLFPEFAGLNGQDSRSPPTNLYIQTLHLLSPHRGNGVAASLLNALLFAKPPSVSSKSYRVSSLVRHYNIHTVTAHVHETNDEGLRWYVARGFHVEDGVVKGYYRRLNPGGARIVRLDLDWDNDEQEEEAGKQQQDSENSLQSSDVTKATISANEEQSDDEDDDWEKLEPEEDDADDHGVVHLTDSQILDDNSPTSTASLSGKRKRDLEQFQKRHK